MGKNPHEKRALDCRVYSYAALKILNPNFERIGERLKENAIKIKLQELKQKLSNKESDKPDEPAKENMALKMRKKRKINSKQTYAQSWRV